jgi:hypothetical protein
MRSRHVARVGLAALALACLAACGPQFDKSFNTAWATKMHDSCVKGATGAGAAADIAERYCACIVTQLSPLPVAKKMQLGPTTPEAQAAETYCKAQAQHPAS